MEHRPERKKAGTTIYVEIPDAVVEDAAERVADLVVERLAQDKPSPSGYLNVAQAAEYLAAPRSRIYDLVSLRRVQHVKDGRRTLFRPEWLDAVLAESSHTVATPPPNPHG